MTVTYRIGNLNVIEVRKIVDGQPWGVAIAPGNISSLQEHLSEEVASQIAQQYWNEEVINNYNVVTGALNG